MMSKPITPLFIILCVMEVIDLNVCSREPLKELNHRSLRNHSSRKAKENIQANAQSRKAKENIDGYAQSRKAKENIDGYAQSRKAKENIDGYVQSRKAKENIDGYAQSRKAKENIDANVQSRKAKENIQANAHSRKAKENIEANVQSRKAKENIPNVHSRNLRIMNATPEKISERNSGRKVSGNNQGRNDTKKYRTSRSGREDKRDICMTNACHRIATRISKCMDKDADPCTDFYAFVCGRFLKKTDIPKDKAAVNSFEIVVNLIHQQLKDVLKKPIKSNDPMPDKIYKTAYASCMNTGKIEDLGLKPARNMLKVIGKWPVLEGSKWNERSFSWDSASYKFRKFGLPIDLFVSIKIDTDMRNMQSRIIQLDEPSHIINKVNLMNGMEDTLVKAYYRFMVETAILFGADRVRAQNELRESLEFEINLARAQGNGPKMTTVMPLGAIANMSPYFDIGNYINNMMAPVRVFNNENIVIANPGYFQRFLSIIAFTRKRVVANYMMWVAIAKSLNFLNDAARIPQRAFKRAELGVEEQEPRWKECVELERLSLAVGSMYIRRYFREDKKEATLQMVQEIREQLYHTLRYADWMDEGTRYNALSKAKLMLDHIAYPDELLDIQKLTEHYRKLENVDHSDFFNSHFIRSKWQQDVDFSRLRELVNRTDWIRDGKPAVVNALYHPLENSIKFPAGILQYPFFSSTQPRYMNYGAIGTVIGHEMTHGFDTQGSAFDGYGNSRNWWDPSTRSRYLAKVQCMIRQYGSYVIKEVNVRVDGEKTQTENIADNGGVRMAYKAYSAWASRHTKEQKLPGLEQFSPKQMFWISTANLYCSKMRREKIRKHVVEDRHSPPEFRIIGSFSNQESFAHDFKCPNGSRMNPLRKCKVW